MKKSKIELEEDNGPFKVEGYFVMRIPKKAEKNMKEVLENMCVLGSEMKKEIIEEKKNNSKKFISIKEATKKENKDKGIFALGILAENLEKFGIITAIEKDSSNDDVKANKILNYITNGMITKKNMNYILIWVMKEIINY